MTRGRAEAVAAAGAVRASTSAHFVPFAFQGRDGSDFSHGQTRL